ncbi:WD40 repeat domain-containing serine/threonine protein kinase [Kitasatospora sp. NPDC058162]|uniref:WD40 repeat domain-containing serine/threonine protein kinase n=1 Tax=Kitasatospora sp. NPDC058162 TaxID=3346362 RepID=UPI0036D8062F
MAPVRLHGPASVHTILDCPGRRARSRWSRQADLRRAWVAVVPLIPVLHNGRCHTWSWRRSGGVVQAGEHISGRYRLDARLGHGGMGEVWRGFDVELGRAVAVKVLLEFDASDEQLRRFRREASIGARLQHPGITVVHDVGQHEGRMFIVMELLEGTDLAGVLARSPSGLPVAEAVGLALQAAEALAAAHTRQVVHRDLKPGNLFLLADGRLKICDFGIARTMGDTEGLTTTGRPFGTPAYMAPEQWRGERVDAQCDMYALGCVLYALLTGAPPFPVTEQAWALMRKHLDVVPEGVRSVRAEVPGEVEELVASLLAKDPAARPDAPTTAEHLRTMLHSALVRDSTLMLESTPKLDTAPTQTAPPPSLALLKPDTVPGTLAPPRGPRRRNVILGGLAALAAATGASLIGLRLADGTSPAPHPSVSAGPSPSNSSGPSPSVSPDQRLWFTLAGHTDMVDSVVFSPDGETLASASFDDTVRLWDLATRTSIATLTGHTDVVYSVAFSPDGKTLASASNDKTVRLWDLATRTSTATLTGHTDAVSTVAFSPDGKTLASASNDKTVRLWDLATRTSTATLTGHTDAVSTVAFSPDGKTLASASFDHTVRLWDLATRTSTATLTGHSYQLYSVAFSPDGKTLASGGLDDTVRLWDLATRTSAATLTAHADVVNAVAFSPDGKSLACAGGNKTIQLWDLATRTSTATLTGHTGAVGSVAFSLDGKTFASASNDKTIRLWKLS